MGPPDRLGVLETDKEQSDADHIREARARLLQGPGDELEAAGRLGRGIGSQEPSGQTGAVAETSTLSPYRTARLNPLRPSKGEPLRSSSAAPTAWSGRQVRPETLNRFG